MGTKHGPDGLRSVMSDLIASQLHWCAAGLTLKRLGYFGGWKDWGGGGMMALP